jgi:hypothetical protein
MTDLSISGSLRTLIMTTSLFFCIMYSLYSAFLISALTSTSDPIRSFADALKHGYSVYANPSIDSNFASKGKYKQPSKLISNNYHSFQAVMAGGHVHIDHVDSFKFYAPLINLSPEDICKRISLVPFDSGISSGFFLNLNSSRGIRESINSK